MSISEKKAELRKQIRRLQAQISAEDARLSNRHVMDRVLSLAEYQQASTVFCFVGTSREIDTKPLLQDALARHKKLAVPRCAGSGIMHAYAIHSLGDLAEGAYGILEPRSNCPLIPPDEIEFGVIPCVSCDTHGNRLGHGGGYYDRYLAGTSFPTAALCREILLCKQIPVDALDKPVNMVVTDRSVYRTGNHTLSIDERKTMRNI